MRHVHDEYPVNIIVEPGVAEEVQEKLPFAFTPPANGELCCKMRADGRCAWGVTSDSGCDYYVRRGWNDITCRVAFLINLCPSNSILFAWNIRFSPTLQYPSPTLRW